MGSVIVCGFYTEDYRRWLIPLMASLDRLGQAYDFVLAEKSGPCGKPTRWPTPCTSWPPWTGIQVK
jgi:hypothetical protein